MEKMEKEIDQLRSELQQLENYNQYLASECRKKDTIIDRQKHPLKNEKAKTKATENYLLEIWNKNVLNRPATLYEIFFGNKFCFKRSDQKTLPHMKSTNFLYFKTFMHQEL